MKLHFWFSLLIILLASTSFAQMSKGTSKNLLMAAGRPQVGGSGGVDVGTPYAWWKMTGTDTNTTQLLDSNGTYNFTNTSVTFVSTNSTYYYYSFDGSTSKFIGTNTTAFVPTSMTASAWVWLKAQPSAASSFGVVARYSQTVANWPWFLRASAGPTYSIAPFRGKASFWVNDNLNSNGIGRATSDSITLSNWTHIVAVWDGGKTTNSIKMYINGSLSQGPGYAYGTFTGLEPSSDKVRMGNENNANFMNGFIDDVRYYTNTLSASQITNLYQSRNQP
jgi:hypothetical protein